MGRAASTAARGAERARSELAARLIDRRAEIEQAVLTRAYSVSDPSEAADPTYVDGLRAAVSAALDFSLATVERGEERAPPIPAPLLNQARLAARNGVSLDTVLRRYFAGYTLIGDFLVGEAEGIGLKGAALKRLLRAQAALFDRVVTVVTEEFSREAEGRLDSAEQRRAERVKRLLDGELLDTSELEYELNGHHLGAIASGPEAAEASRELAKALDCRLLLVRRGEGTVWAWLGGRCAFDPAELERVVSETWPGQTSLAIGEPGEGLAGWRLTHRQACAALPIALYGRGPFVRYADVALLASILQDDLLATSLRELYLAPLEHERDGGEALRRTLRSYFAADRNVSSTAAALGVNRQTVVNRLRAIEERFDRPLRSCAAEVETALSLQELGYPILPHAALARG